MLVQDESQIRQLSKYFSFLVIIHVMFADASTLTDASAEIVEKVRAMDPSQYFVVEPKVPV